MGWDKPSYEVKKDLEIHALYEDGEFLTYPVVFLAIVRNQWRVVLYECVKAGDTALIPKKCPNGKEIHFTSGIMTIPGFPVHETSMRVIIVENTIPTPWILLITMAAQ